MSRSRPLGLAAGAAGLAMAWLGGAAIVQLTGATPVLILLVAGVVAGIVAVVTGRRALNGVVVGTPVLPTLVSRGEEFSFAVPVRTLHVDDTPVWIEVRTVGGRNGDRVGAGWSDGGQADLTGSIGRRGQVDALELRVRAAGAGGLVWWSRRVPVALDRPTLVAAPLGETAAEIERVVGGGGSERAGRAGAVAGQIDGVRPWRDGDSDRFVHWPTTLRVGELVVHDRRHDTDERWVVRARVGTADPDTEAGAARRALVDGLQRGAEVSVAVGDAEPEPIADADTAARWSATAPLGAPPPAPGRRGARGPAEPEQRSTARARWWAAAASWIALVMLAGVLAAGPLTYALITVGIVAGAWTTAGPLVSGEPVSGWWRAVAAVISMAALALVLASSGRFDGLLGLFSGPLPTVLMVLVVLHGFECRDRRSVRVVLGVSAVVVMYAAALRVDDRLVWWLAAWVIVVTVALREAARPPARPDGARAARTLPPRAHGRRPGVRMLATAGLVVVITMALLAVIPVPRGPAVLALPSLIEGQVDAPLPGAVVSSDGEVITDGADGSDGDRSPAGTPGGYVGFSDTMDTSVRGDLPDDVVMRVRASEPAFWRGQTFSSFDGRRWHADDDIGRFVPGPEILLPGPGRRSSAEVDDFVQTYYFDGALPNVVFHAERPRRVYIDVGVYVRPDGSMRAATTLPRGSIYTVVSDRVRVDDETLRGQGSIGARLTPVGQEALAEYLAVPPTTTPETVALADELAAGRRSTYDVILAYEAWMTQNVEYDLNAPLPDPGEDAVHDFLFDSRRGFCEQIASALAIMLRTQGVPTRVATGFIPGERDPVTGVFEVRASDAHAWVEVWFPDTGWQSFDPTASVPLSADAAGATIGGELVAAVSDFVAAHARILAPAALLVGLMIGVSALARERRRRRVRGRWGLLHDRFAAAAAARGAPAGATSTVLAAAFTGDAAEPAADLAARLDRAAFDPSFDRDDESELAAARRLVGALGAGSPGRPTRGR